MTQTKAERRAGKAAAKQFNLRLAPDLHARIAAAAKADHRPKTQFIEKIILDFLDHSQGNGTGATAS